MSKLYNYKTISKLISYTPDEIVNNLQQNRVTKRKVNTWIKNGLTPICNTPTLINGNDIINFLKNINSTNHKLDLQDDEFFCFACKLAQIPLGHRIHVVQQGNIIRAKGICPDTKKTMVRTYNLKHFCEIKKNFNIVEEKRLYNSFIPNTNSPELNKTSAQNQNTLFLKKGDQNDRP